MSSLNSRKACGYDGQPPRLLKLGAPILSFTLLPILNNAIEQNVFPTDLKYAEVIPLFKKDDKMYKKKYRPISVLVCQSKVFEGIMVDHLMQFMNVKLSDSLSAYRNDYSTQHVLLHAIEEWKVAHDNCQHVGGPGSPFKTELVHVELFKLKNMYYWSAHSQKKPERFI